jgi:hypothetical protein
MAKLNSTGVRLEPEVRANLEKIARKKRWSLSQAIAVAVEEWLQRNINGNGNGGRKEPRNGNNGDLK